MTQRKRPDVYPNFGRLSWIMIIIQRSSCIVIISTDIRQSDSRPVFSALDLTIFPPDVRFALKSGNDKTKWFLDHLPHFLMRNLIVTSVFQISISFVLYSHFWVRTYLYINTRSYLLHTSTHTIKGCIPARDCYFEDTIILFFTPEMKRQLNIEFIKI